MNAPIVGILGTLTVLPLAAQVYWPTTPKTVGIVPARHRHAPAVIQRRPDGTVTGSPWSGYVATGAPGSVTDAKGSWIVPSVTCKSGSQSSVFWVGIDGYGNNTVEQIGTASDCADGIPNYYAWYEFYPQPELRLFTVKPGDPISAEASYSGGMFTVTLTDERTGRQGGQSLAWPDAQRSTAECVAEDPSSVTHVIDPLAEFGTVLFGYDNTGVANTCYATVGAQAGPIGSLPGAFPLSMVNNGTPEAAPSLLSSDGSSFSVTWTSFSPLFSFNGGNGAAPSSPLLQALDGNFYGTTESGGEYDSGTVFKITPSGTMTTLYNFCSQTGCTDGANPYSGLVQATNGDFYGTTLYGGSGNCYFEGYPECGTVFRITPGGTLKTLYTFCVESGCADGANPYAGLVQAANGGLYGTTMYGGANGQGTVFEINPSGMMTTLYSFCSQGGLGTCTDGCEPFAGLTQAASGDFYGTTEDCANAYDAGTVFKITPSGALTTLYTFCSQGGCADGANPFATLVQGTDGNFYGATYNGGTSGNYGTVFKITPGGALTTLHVFGGYPTDGANPYFAGPIQATNGDFYGTTQFGGASGYGTVFDLSVGLGPFVETQPASGKVGTVVRILGTNLTGATGVAFNGTPATFTIVSASEITATVPDGATSGKVEVTTAGVTLLSNVAFRVIQ